MSKTKTPSKDLQWMQIGISGMEVINAHKKVDVGGGRAHFTLHACGSNELAEEQHQS